MSGEGAILAQRPATRRFRRGTVICPVCYADGLIAGSDEVTDLVKTLWCHCSNVTCGMTWRMMLSFEFVVSPSAIEHDLHLPPPPKGFVRYIYPAGPCKPEPDPDQLTMFEDGSVEEIGQRETGSAVLVCPVCELRREDPARRACNRGDCPSPHADQPETDRKAA